MITALARTLPYTYTFDAFFVSKLFQTSILIPAITNAENIYNALPRKNKKQINVNINTAKRCLEINLYSAIPIAPKNWLRASQYFSKILSTQVGLKNYIVAGRRLLEQ